MSDEKESNRMCSYDWIGEPGARKLKMAWFDGLVEYFDPRLATVTNRGNAEEYGWLVRFNRLCAVEIKEIPDKKLRAEEGRRRQREYREHIYSGTDAWAIERKAGGSAISEADLTECLDRCYPGKGQQLFAASLAKNGGDLPKTREMWLTTKQVATAWAKLQAERREKRADTLGDADALFASIMAATETPTDGPS